MYSIIEFDPYQADHITWERYFSLYKQLAHSQLNMGEFMLLIQQQCKKRAARYKLIFGERYNTGMVFYSYSKPAKNGTKILYLAFENTISELSEELLSSVTDGVLTLLQASTASSFVTTPDNSVIQEIITRFQGKIINTINYYFLLRANFNSRLLNKLGEDTLFNNHSLSFELHEYVPEHLYHSFSVLMTELMNDIIRSDDREVFEETFEGIKNRTKQFKEAEIRMLVGLLFNQSEGLVGLSFVLVYPNSTIAKQEMTGVIKKYRGKKIATCLKATITKETFRRYPQIEQVQTNCYSSNLPIIKINQALGYSFKEFKSQFLVNRDSLLLT